MQAKCSRCGKIKDLCDFRKPPTRKNRKRTCNVCRKEIRKIWKRENRKSVNAYARIYYSKNKDKYKIKARERERGRHQQNKIWLIEYKKKRYCVECGEKDFRCLVFHHTAKKSFDINKSDSYSREKVMREIAKCVILCANCHSKLHYDEKVRKVKIA